MMLATMRFLSTLLTAFALGALLAGCSNDDENAGGTVAGDLSEERAMLAQIVTEPDGRDGDQATVAGEVVRSGEWAFVLEAEGERLLIVAQSEPERAYEIGTVVRAQGTIAPIPGDDDRDIIGEEPLFDEFEGEPTLAATEITVPE